MKRQNEYTKPLSGYEPDHRASRKRATGLLIGLLLLIGFPVFHFYDGWARVGMLFEQPTEVEVAVVVPTETKVVPETTEEEQSNLPKKAPQDYEIDPDGGELQEVEPQGELVQVTPVPQTLPQVKPIRRQEQLLAHLPDPELIERGATGVIPKKSPDGLRAMDVYSRRPDTEGNFGVARVVIVIGGLGLSQTSTQQAIRELPGSITLAFAPYGNSLGRWMQEARKGGHELLLQVPMEPIDYPTNNPGRHTIRGEAELQENLANLHWAMSRITNYVGITNYLGNKLLQQPAALAPIFAEISKRGLLFFEDGTVQNSIGEGVAIKELLPYARANILLDNVRSRSAIVEKLNKLSQEAKRTGLAIGMGNAFPDTIALVAEYVRQASQNGIEITPVSAIVKDPTK